MRIPFYDACRANEPVADALLVAAEKVIRSGALIMGDELEAFEGEFAAYADVRHCVGVANGLDALFLALKASGIGPGDEVIVPAQTFVATFLAVSATGAVPVAVDVQKVGSNIDPELVTRAISPRTRGIISVNLYGRQCDVNALGEIAARHGITWIEDCAQSHGVERLETASRPRSQARCYSFYPTKNLGALGDGGAVVTNDPDLAAALRMLRNYGSEAKYIHALAGMNSRLDEIQAAMLRCKLPRLDASNQRRIQIAARYAKGLAGLDPEVCRLVSSDAPTSVWHHAVIVCGDREKVQEKLLERGVGTAIHYPVLPARQKPYAHLFENMSFPVAEDLAAHILSLPIGDYLDDGEVDYVIDAVLSAVE